MDLQELTAPCGLDCFNCVCYLANENEMLKKSIMERGHISAEDAVCKGCRPEHGRCPPREALMGAQEPCKAYTCVMARGIESCADCEDFPCDNLQPFAEHAAELPHNIKVYNLALIRKMGVEKWAHEKAKNVRDTYFTGKFNI